MTFHKLFILFRFPSIVPYDHNRVTLEEDIDGEDYINASWISGRQFIATQGPLPGTIVHFLQMIVEQKVEAIVMLCKTSEKNKLGRNIYSKLNLNLVIVSLFKIF